MQRTQRRKAVSAPSHMRVSASIRSADESCDGSMPSRVGGFHTHL